MVEEYLIRDIDSTIYFAQKNANNNGRTSIHMLEFNPELKQSVVTKIIYELNSRLVAMELKTFKKQITSLDQINLPSLKK